MHFADSILIFILALILFGPKKLPEIGKQIGKLLVEFRRASNEFKAQIDEELRMMEQQDRQKKLEEAAALKAPEPTAQPAILPPSTGTVVSTSYPFGAVTPPELPAESAPSQMESTTEPATASSYEASTHFEAAAPEPAAVANHSNGSHGHAPAAPENEQASIHHG